MATHTVNIDVIDKTIPIGNNRVIPVINQPNPALGYAASATRDTTNLVKGVAFVNDDTFSIDRVLAISENANESYYALAVHGIRSRKNFASETVNVFVKYSAAPVSSSITCTYRFV